MKQRPFLAIAVLLGNWSVPCTVKVDVRKNIFSVYNRMQKFFHLAKNSSFFYPQGNKKENIF